jgi:putative addiction module killer protein
MVEVRFSDEFHKWLKDMRDEHAYARIVKRVRRMELGNPGDVKPVGGGLHEMRINYGPGYRIYFVYEGSTVVILLCGGDKDTQTSDVRRARALAGK